MSEKLKIHIFTLIYFLIIIFLSWILKWFWDYILPKIVRKGKLDIKILNKMRNGVIAFIFFSGSSILWERTSVLITEASPTLEKFIMNIPKIIYSLIVISICFIVSGIVDGFVEWYLEEIANRTKTKIDEEFMILFKRISRIIIFFIGITIILNKFNQPITSLLGAAGIASFAIAFAAQDTLSNMISGFFIVIDKPFKIGDRIKLATGEIGEIVEIGMRRTKILSPENNIIIVPNSEIAKTRIVNFSYPDTKIKISLKIGTNLISDTEKVKNLLLNICKNNPFIIENKSEVYLVEITSSQAVFSLNFSIDYKNEKEVIDKLIEELKIEFQKEKIDLIFIRKEQYV
jgi:small-conductance mechanosensitive channel